MNKKRISQTLAVVAFVLTLGGCFVKTAEMQNRYIAEAEAEEPALAAGIPETEDGTGQGEAAGADTAEESGYLADSIEVPALPGQAAFFAQNNKAAAWKPNVGDPAKAAASSLLPESYDARAYGCVTPVKAQQDNTCWAYSAVSMAESDLISGQTPVDGRALTAETADFSEDYLTYAFYHTQEDPLGNTTGDSTRALGWYRDVGGNHIFTTFGLANWTGLATEAQTSGIDWEQEPVDLSGITPKVRMQNAYWINLKENPTLVKSMILQHGSAAISMYYASYYMQKEHAAYYNDVTERVNHAVTLVGWDDSYPASEFKKDPGADGAWLAKNSYGTDDAGEGYFWISYQDMALTSATAKAFVFDFEAADTYDYIYQHDGSAGAYMESGAGDTGYRVTSGDSVANVYTVPADSETGYQTLDAVSFALFAVNVDYSIQIYRNPSDAANPASGAPMLAEPVTGKTSFVGYYTVPLEERPVLSAGDRFSVVLTLSKSNGKAVSFFVDKTYTNGNWISFVNATEAGESFACQPGGWVDLAESGATARIKAFTSDYLVGATALEISRQSLELWKGQTAELTARITPADASYQDALWSSSDSSVAKVDQNGKITAVGKGAAVITAVARDNDSVRAECGITVKRPAESAEFEHVGDDVTCEVGKKIRLKLSVSPENAEADAVWLTSSDETIASVEGKRTVLGKRPGSVVIHVYSSCDQHLLASCTVRVRAAQADTEDAGTDQGESPGGTGTDELNEPRDVAAGASKLNEATGTGRIRTGDTNQTGFWLAAGGVSLLFAGAAQWRFYREKKRKQ